MTKEIRDLETPCYIIRRETYQQNIQDFREAFESRWKGQVLLGYSVKTNNFPYLLREAIEQGLYAEVVSPDEWEFALRCGCTPEHIIYNGPQKRETVLTACRDGATVNLDSLDEVDLVCRTFEGSDKKPQAGVRVNFDLEALCPGETTCEGIPGRFGICLENGDFAQALKMLEQSRIPLAGLHLHQSSKSRSLNIFRAIAEKATEIGRAFGLDNLDFVDMGGGFFGGNYFPGKPAPDEYAETICEILQTFYDPNKTTLILEPGAAILATAMEYLTSVLNIRDVRGNRIVTVDGSLLHVNPGMKPHPTPFMMIDPGEETQQEQIIGGSTCMELDRFWPRDLHQLAGQDSKFLFYCCGAYMSTHNSSFINAAPNIYLYENEEYNLVRRKSLDSLFL